MSPLFRLYAGRDLELHAFVGGLRVLLSSYSLLFEADMYIYIYVYIYVYTYIVFISMCLLSIYLLTHLSICLYIHVFIYISSYLDMYIYIYVDSTRDEAFEAFFAPGCGLQ